MNTPGIFLSCDSSNVYGVFPSYTSGQLGPMCRQRERAMLRHRPFFFSPAFRTEDTL